MVFIAGLSGFSMQKLFKLELRDLWRSKDKSSGISMNVQYYKSVLNLS